MEEKPKLETIDFYLACYLKASGLPFVGVSKEPAAAGTVPRLKPGESAKKFVFLKVEGVNTGELLEKWNSSETDFFRKLLEANTELKFALKEDRRR